MDSTTSGVLSYSRPLGVLCYDYVITFGQEVRCIWMRKKTGATVLYLFIRYVCLVSYCILPAVTYILTLNVEVR